MKTTRTATTPTTHGTVTPLVRPRSGGSMSQAGSVQGTLALDLANDQEPPLPTGDGFFRGADVVEVSSVIRRDLQRWVHTFSQAVVEVTGGVRPASQLLRWATPAVHNELAYRAGVVSRARVHQAGRGGPVRPMVRPQVQTVHTSFLDDEVVEFSVRVRHGQRSRALAGRLEVLGGRWQATALEFG